MDCRVKPGNDDGNVAFGLTRWSLFDEVIV
jgi:hypothetical protein